MANENLIATVSNPNEFFALKNLIGQTINNDGEDIATVTQGLIQEGTLQYMGEYRFFARFISEGWSEIEIDCRPTSVEGTQMIVTDVKIVGESTR